MPAQARQSRQSKKATSKKGSAWITFFVIVLCIVGLVARFGKMLHLSDLAKLKLPRVASGGNENAGMPAGKIISENHFAPDENLEQLDYDRLENAQHRVDIAMYAFTDKYLADQLMTLARRGVTVRVYRDMDQYKGEQRNADEHRDDSVTQLLHGERNIYIRVKSSGRRDLMHLKAYAIDGKLLRDGSANWSAAGEKAQDNNAHFTNDPAEVKSFEQQFEEMWSRSDNVVVQ
jgi:phosphatidylserine/phosphatidylglycerophosphate/cardiolipin synthase-like enzyme